MLVHIAVSNDGEYDDVCESRLYKTADGYLHIWTSGPDYIETVVRDDDVDLYAEVGRSFEPDLMLAAYRRYKINNVECVDCLLRSEWPLSIISTARLVADRFNASNRRRQPCWIGWTSIAPIFNFRRRLR